MKSQLRLSWIPASKNPSSASFRLRVAMIMEELRKRGHICEFYSESSRFDILIVSKKYDSNTLQIMERAKAKNPKCRIVFDICDNHFHTDKKDVRQIQNHSNKVNSLNRALELADAVTTSSKYLTFVIASLCQIESDVIYTIEDCFETEQKLIQKKGIKRWLAELKFRWLKWQLKTINESKDRFVWFGTHGVEYAEGGMTDLLEQQQAIFETLGNSNRSLTIISNSYFKYKRISRKLNVRTFYVPWNQYTVDRILRLHAFLLLPIKLTPFTSSKSSNRLVTAMTNGLLVICDMIPAYEELRQHVITPVNAGNLKYAIAMEKETYHQHTNDAQTHVLNKYSINRIAENWETAFLRIYSSKPR